MSSLSFENVFSSDTSDASADAVRPAVRPGSTERTAEILASRAASSHQIPGTPVTASPWALSLLRRGLEMAVAIIALVALSPLMLLAALFVRFGSTGPVFFRQRRMGRHGHEFTLFKFRSMCPRKGNNSSITVSGDTRVTPVGAFLRRYKLDELPQFWNVLRGDMSLVGPRPKLPHHEALRMACRPGITGAATLAFRNEEEFLSEIPEDQLEAFYETFVKPAKAHLDLEYLRTATLSSDLRILLRTAGACFFSSDKGMAESAATIMQYEHAARIRAGRYSSVGHSIPKSIAYPATAGINQEL
jgi:lipopolysaccharide/colanic/teichoic acid biosynthesis glycosyltransferase